jgi:hypothetical protein
VTTRGSDYADAQEGQRVLGAYTLDGRVEAIAERGRRAAIEKGVSLDV